MSTCVNNAVICVLVRQVIVLLAAVKRELENLHAGIARLLHKLGDVGCERAQILGNDLKLADLLFHHAEELDPRTYDPLAVDGVLGGIGNGVVARKRAEVVDTGNIVKL